MHDFGTIPTANMTYTKSQNYTNMVDGKHGIQTFKSVVVVLLLLLLFFDIFVPTSAHPLLFLNKWVVQLYLNDSYVPVPTPWDQESGREFELGIGSLGTTSPL